MTEELEKTFNHEETKKFINKRLRKTFIKNQVKKCSFVAALAIFIISLTFNVLVFSVSVIRGPVLDFFMGENTDYATKGTHNAIYINNEEISSPRYIPEGAEIQEIEPDTLSLRSSLSVDQLVPIANSVPIK